MRTLIILAVTMTWPLVSGCGDGADATDGSADAAVGSDTTAADVTAADVTAADITAADITAADITGDPSEDAAAGLGDVVDPTAGDSGAAQPDATSVADAASALDTSVADHDTGDGVLSSDDSGQAEDIPAPPADSVTDVPAADVPAADTTAADAAGEGDATAEPDAAWDSLIGQSCFAEIYDPEINGPDYDQFAPTIAEHCLGTNHQDITGVERVVILGDSVAQGTPNDVHPLSTDNSHFWRNLFAEWAAVEFGLDQGDDLGIEWGLWKAYDYLSGKGTLQFAGDFSNCAKWGARTDDFLEGGGQVGECFPEGGSDENTLIVFTMGGNDIAKITQIGGEATPEEVAAGYPAAWALAESTVGYLAEALYWLKDPEKFPNGSHVIYANPFEFTDGTGLVDACSPQSINVPFVGELDVSDLGINMAGLAGFASWEKPEVQEAIVIWLLEQYMKLAVETATDMVWMLELFCGHGYVATGPDADVDNRCYRGPDAELYFDLTCIHPSDAGHNAIYEMFKASVLE